MSKRPRQEFKGARTNWAEKRKSWGLTKTETAQTSKPFSNQKFETVEDIEDIDNYQEGSEEQDLSDLYEVVASIARREIRAMLKDPNRADYFK